MARRVLVVQLVPAEDFAQLLSELRARDPEVELVALAATGKVSAADETIDWRDHERGALLAELRRREFERVVVAHGLDHYATRAYWKAVLLARAVAAKEVVVCEGGSLAGRHGMGAGARRALLSVLWECVAGVLGLLVLVPLALGGLAVDVLGAPTRGRRQERERAKDKIV